MGAPDLLANLTAIGVTVAVHSGNLIVQPWSLVPGDMRRALQDAKPDLLNLLAPRSSRPYRLTAAEADVAHAESWDDATIARFQAREEHIHRLEFGAQDAEDLAMRLQLRDVHADHRHLCIECRNYRPGRCSHHRAADLNSPEVSREWATMFQDCPGFAPSVAVPVVPPRGPT